MKQKSILTAFTFGVIGLLLFGVSVKTPGQATPPRFRALVLTEEGGQHGPYVVAAKQWLQKLAAAENFTFEIIHNTDQINDAFLARYQLFIQLNYPPYAWTDTAKAAFEKYINEGKGGWVGFHHATLLGDFDGYKMWPWFSDFMGGIKFVNYIAGLASATVRVEAPQHPCLVHLPASFTVDKDEWYTYDKSPRPNVRVLASVNESSYAPDSKIKMGDHPVVWTNERVKARNIYIFMGHHPDLFQNEAYTTLVRNAIFWAAKADVDKPAFKAIAFYNTKVEKAHVQFAQDAVAFFERLAAERHFAFEATTDWTKLNADALKDCQLVIWLNDSAHTPPQREAFQKYMEGGGAWLGFHVAAYNDRDTHWPWFLDFLGGGVFFRNNWPPLPAVLKVDDPAHPVTRSLPPSFTSPSNEWYQWKPSPRLNKNIKVLVTLDPSNYPLGKKDILPDGDLPVVWSNTKYKMVYLNMGHGDKIFTDPTQNKMIADALLWLGQTKP